MSDPLTYRNAGVDIDAAMRCRSHQALRQAHHAPGGAGGTGGFGALCAIPAKYKEPILVSGTDGVGTKLKLAFLLNRHGTVGIDLVAMSVNDVLVQGAEPLFFLDYFACGKLDTNVATNVIRGIAKGCEEAGCALIGGETAKCRACTPRASTTSPDSASASVEKERIIDGKTIQAGDVLLGLASSGPHSNGFSLIRRILGDAKPNSGLADSLMEPTRIYVKPFLKLLRAVKVKGLAHITGRRPGRQRAAHAAARHARRAAQENVAAARTVQPAAERRQHRRSRNAPRLQLRHRHGALRRARPGRRRHHAPQARGELAYEIGFVEAGNPGEPEAVVLYYSGCSPISFHQLCPALAFCAQEFVQRIRRAGALR
jgi:phosphoribosylformylglycinamidine cyclo-ligase